MALTMGVDISTWQRSVPANAGAFVICRGTYGVFTDSRVEQHVRNARARGLHVGLYAFLTRNGDGKAEAEAIQRVAERFRVTRVALDWEADGTRGMMPESEAREAMARLLALRGEAGLYMSSWQFRDLGQTWDWVAKWASTPPSWRGWEFWQYQGTPIDRNYFAGTPAELEAFFNRTAPPIPKPVPRPTDPEPAEVEPMFNIAPLTTHRDAVLRAGTVLYRDGGLKRRHSRTENGVALGFVGSTGTAHVVVNSGNTNYVRRSDVEQIVANDRSFD